MTKYNETLAHKRSSADIWEVTLMRSSLALVACLAAALAGCAHQKAAQPKAASTPTLLIEARGITMRLSQAVRKISFRPILPSRQILAFAVIPPLGGNDTPQTRGFAAEYLHHGAAVLISEWPKQSFRITFGKVDITEKPCVQVEYARGQYAFTNKRGLLATVQGDAGVSPAAVHRAASAALAAFCR